MSTSPATARHLYRSILRELSKQHNTASKLHAEKDKQRLETLLKYQRMKNAAAGIKTDPKELEAKLKKDLVKRYDTTVLREFFTTGDAAAASAAEGQGREEYLRSVSRFLTSQRTYKELLELYNGSLIDEDQRIQLSARRVGLELPKEK
ncbi:hypothetical protein DV495_000434 [Geotrichum candidum]|uniref:Similar to Saccharomyces cerevisiae YIL098C FMC1 Mitochondrial matrix protein n=1 Tax=Geotrichum candidum TaxID=1173061 RepID=A0A0J9XD45_GEOCN|nr:hypothetical protein DV452_004296 [Geotrichum candidum]KAI9214770.1 hypothetical protein DS838_000269 [Geotrichum bryndzae]KAF5112656.1 hypothetical protein DV454_004096 [Geotrichum candidum]KAF5135852.1 hypothetical protein DV495_000434 [Geotrichum candidum]KAF7500124.1 hypothetical protein DV113_001848 [Geotrichum candidum]